MEKKWVQGKNGHTLKAIRSVLLAKEKLKSGNKLKFSKNRNVTSESEI